MALTLIQQVRLEIGDNVPEFPILSDDEYTYFLDKNNQSVRRTALDAAKTILFILSQKTNSRVDIFEISGSQAARAYMDALKVYIKSPDLNTVLQNAQGYVGGVSIQDMQANDANTDNNIVEMPTEPSYRAPDTFFNV